MRTPTTNSTPCTSGTGPESNPVHFGGRRMPLPLHCPCFPSTHPHFYSGFRRKSRIIKCNRFPRQKGGHGPRRSMRRLRKLGTRNTTLLACDRKFWQVSRHKRSSRIQRCWSFSERVGPRIIFFKASQVSSCSKRSRGITTEPIACGFCCYFRSYNIAIKRTKYENVFGLVASHKICWSPNC